MDEFRRLKRAVKYVQAKLGDFKPQIAITLGSGLGDMVNLLQDAQSISYKEIPGCPITSVLGHEGRLWWGLLGGVRVLIFQGRVHYYENLDVQDAVFHTRLAGMLGVKQFILTHAVGSATRNLEPGDIVGIRSQIPFGCPDPTAGYGMDQFGTEPFTSLENVLNPAWLRLAKKCAIEVGVPFSVGVSHFWMGRSFQMDAGTIAISRAGATVATMSTIAETIAAAQMGALVLDLAIVTDMCSGLGIGPVSHDDVLRVVNAHKEGFGRLIMAVVQQMVA